MLKHHIANPRPIHRNISTIAAVKSPPTAIETNAAKIARMAELLRERIAQLPPVVEVRQCGFIAGVELHGDPAGRLLGREVCNVARGQGLLTRPIGDVIVLMPPYCITDAQLESAVEAIRAGIVEVTEA